MANNSYRIMCTTSLKPYIINDKSKVNFIAIGIIDIIVMIPAIILNALFLYTTYKHSRLRKTISNCLLINLALLGLAVAMLNFPLHAMHMFLTANGMQNCVLSTFNDSASFTLSELTWSTLIFITGDSYFGVISPFFYKSYFTKSTVLAFLWVIWVVLFVATITLIHFYLQAYIILVCVCVAISTCIFVFAYVRICCVVNKMHGSVSCYTAKPTTKRSSSIRFKTPKKTSKTSLYIVLAFIMAYFPISTYTLMQVFKLENSITRTYIFHWYYAIRLSNSLVNAFLYYLRLKELRNATLSFMPKWIQTRLKYKRESLQHGSSNTNAAFS